MFLLFVIAGSLIVGIMIAGFVMLLGEDDES